MNLSITDSVSMLISGLSILFITITSGFLVAAFIEIVNKRRSLKAKQELSIKGLMKYFAVILIVMGFGYCLYRIPDTLYSSGLSWENAGEWASKSFVSSILLVFLSALLFSAYSIVVSLFPKADGKDFFLLAVVSIVSGFGNALIIFIINEVLNRGIGHFESGLLLYFTMGTIVYLFGQRQVRARLIGLTNGMVYSKRMELVRKVLKSSYHSVERMEPGAVQAGLNNDTEVVSGFAGIFITGLTNMVTVVCCLIYAGIISLYGLLISLLVTLIAAGLYYFAGRAANKLWEQCRDIQNTFFKFIGDITGGFKELALNRLKRNEFEKDMQASCKVYREKRQKADLNFTNVFIIGELLFAAVMAIVVFAFPVLLDGISIDSLRNYVLIFLYAHGPVYTILSIIPGAVQIKISWNRIRELTNRLSSLEGRQDEEVSGLEMDEALCLELEGVEFRYEDEDGKAFCVGPIDCKFNSGEITFITGGNGSGKSTLAKLITGLYRPANGHITINGRDVRPEALGERYSAIFSDFYLFEKLYGINCAKKQGEIEKYLRIFHIEDKLQVKEGAFSTTRLSTGQRKRLALLVSYLEDKPICLFDEWAADQDPEFRRYFYNTLLPELKGLGKCVIAITHDDGYFYAADRVIKMDTGKIAGEEVMRPVIKSN